MARPIKRGSTDVTVYVKIIDSTTGAPETEVAYNTSGIDLWYMRYGADHVAITEADLATVDIATTAHSDGGFKHVSDGVYRLDLPDAACAAATGVDSVTVGGTVTGMIVIPEEYPLVAYDPYDSVRMGMTALPNAAADAAGGLPISDAGGLDLDAQVGTKINSILEDTETTLQGELDGIQTDTEDLQTQIGTAGAGLTAVPWNASWDAEVQSEVTDSLVAHNLDHLALTATASATDLTAEVADGTVLSYILANGDTSAFDPSTDGLQPLKDSLATASEIVDEWETQSQADPTGFHVNVLEVNGTAQTANDNGADINEILVDTSTTLQAELDGIQADTEDIQTQIGTAGAGLTAINLPNQTMDIVGNITGNLSGSVASVTGAVGSVTAGVALTATGIDAIWDEAMQTGLSGRNALRAMLAFIAGKTSGAATTQITFRDVGDTINMIVQNVDSEGDRSSTVLTFV